MEYTEIIVVGAGPTGLTLACDLLRRGIAVRIIDKASVFHGGSRAKILHPRSLEVFDDLGVINEIMAFGKIHMPFRKFNKAQLLGENDPYAERNPTPDIPYNCGVFIPQWRVEDILRRHLASFGVQVELNMALTGISQDDEGVTGTISDKGTQKQIRAAFMVGCDGAHSTVRKALNIGFTGITKSEYAIFGDIEVDGLTPDAWHMWLDPEFGVGVSLCPMPGTPLWQFFAFVKPDEQGALPEASMETFRNIFIQRACMPEIKINNLRWPSGYQVNARRAESFRLGRVFIAGDAAHIHSIAGGMGLNIGIQDAYNLAWKIALAQSDVTSLLGTYEEERIPVASWAIDTSIERHRVILSETRSLRAGIESGLSDETSQLKINYRESSLSRMLLKKDGLQAGDRAPDAPCYHPITNETVRLFDVFRGPHFTLLGFGAGCTYVLQQAAVYKAHLSTCLIAPVTETVINTLHDAEGYAAEAYSIKDTDDILVLVRPDGYIGLIVTVGDAVMLYSYLNEILLSNK